MTMLLLQVSGMAESKNSISGKKGRNYCQLYSLKKVGLHHDILVCSQG